MAFRRTKSSRMHLLEKIMRCLAAVLVLIASVLVEFVPAAAEDADRAAAYYADCQAKAAARKWKDAITDCNKAIGEKPDYIEAYDELGLDTLNYGNSLAPHSRDKSRAAYSDAAGVYAKAISLKPDCPRLYVVRAHLLGDHMGDQAGAIADFSRALELTGSGWCNPTEERWRLFADRATLRRATGDIDGAIADYGAAIGACPQENKGECAAPYYANRAGLKKAKGDVNGAILDGTAATLLSSSLHADLIEATGDLDGTIAKLSSAIRLSSKTEDYRARSALKREKGDIDGAANDLTFALLVDPCSGAAFSDRAYIRKLMGDISGAQADDAEAKQLNSGAGLFGSDCERSMNFVVGFGPGGALIGVQFDGSNGVSGSGVYPQDSPIARAYLAQKAAEYEADARKEMASNNWGAAELDFTKEIKLGNDNPDSYINRGTVRENRGDVDGAFADFSRAIHLSPEDGVAFFDRGVAYSNGGEYNLAIQDFNEAIRLNPNDADALNNRGIAYSLKGDNDRAIQDLDQVIRLSPSRADAFFNRGIAYDSKGDPEHAVQDYNQAMRLNPTKYSAGTLQSDGFSCILKGLYDRAIYEFSEAIRLNPNDPHGFDARGFAYFSKGDYDRATQDFSGAIRVNPSDADAFGGRCLTRAVVNDLQNALSDCNESLRLQTNRNALALGNRGFVNLKLKNADAAIADYNAAIAIDHTIARPFYGRGIAELMKGDKAKSDADIAAAKAIDPKIADEFVKWGIPPVRP